MHSWSSVDLQISRENHLKSVNIKSFLFVTECGPDRLKTIELYFGDNLDKQV